MRTSWWPVLHLVQLVPNTGTLMLDWVSSQESGPTLKSAIAGLFVCLCCGGVLFGSGGGRGELLKLAAANTVHPLLSVAALAEKGITMNQH